LAGPGDCHIKGGYIEGILKNISLKYSSMYGTLTIVDANSSMYGTLTTDSSMYGTLTIVDANSSMYGTLTTNSSMYGTLTIDDANLLYICIIGTTTWTVKLANVSFYKNIQKGMSQ